MIYFMNVSTKCIHPVYGPMSILINKSISSVKTKYPSNVIIAMHYKATEIA